MNTHNLPPLTTGSFEGMPSVTHLRAHQQAALDHLLSQRDATRIFEVWSEFHRVWKRLDSPGELLRYLATLWHELNDNWKSHRQLAPVLNQFVYFAFKDIHLSVPRNFHPEVAPSEVQWHAELSATIRELNGFDTPGKQKLLDAMLGQYDLLYGDSAAAEVDQLLTAQLSALAAARVCRASTLIFPDQIGTRSPTDPELLGFLKIVARFAGFSQRTSVVDATTCAQMLVPTGAVHAHELRQLLGFWAARAPWFFTFVSRHCPPLAPQSLRLSDPPGDALPAPRGCDLHVLLVGSASARTSDWLLASERAAAGSVAPVRVKKLSAEGDLEALRSAWLAGESQRAAQPAPRIGAERAASKVCRLLCWEAPPAYFESIYDSAAFAARTGSGALARSDAATARELIRLLGQQQPSAGVLLLDHHRLLSPQSPHERSLALQPYLNAIHCLAELLAERQIRPENYPWVIVFTNSAWLKNEERKADTDEQLRAEFSRELTGASLDGGAQEIITVRAATPDELGRNVESHSRVLRCPALGARLANDLSQISDVVRLLLEAGFRSISFSYASSTAHDAQNWPALVATWEFLERWLSRATLAGRRAFLHQRFGAEIAAQVGECQARAAFPSGVTQGLTEIGATLKATGGVHEVVNLPELWQNLQKRVGREVFSSRNFAPLWHRNEEEERMTRESRGLQMQALHGILKSLLSELGIPDQTLSGIRQSVDDGLSSSDRMALRELVPNDAESNVLLKLVSKPQPLSPVDDDLIALRHFGDHYDSARGSLSSGCILRDRSANAAESVLLGNHGGAMVSTFLLDAAEPLEQKARLLLSLLNFAPAAWKSHLVMHRFEQNDIKHQVISDLWREVAIADLLLINWARMTIIVAEGVREQKLQGAGLQYRFDQLVALLDAGGWNATQLASDPAAGSMALRKLVDLWKDYYRNFGPHRGKRRDAIANKLTEQYDRLRKPMTTPPLDGDIPRELAIDHERGVHLAAYCLELLTRLPRPAARDATASSENLAQMTLGEYLRRSELLLKEYLGQKARCHLREAGLWLELSGWLQGVGRHRELIGRDIMKRSHSEAQTQAVELSRVIDELVRDEAIWTGRSFAPLQ